MHWKTKANALAILSRIPLGKRIYLKLQELAGSNRLQLDRDLERTYELFRLCQASPQTVEGADVVEIGTGWRPLTAFVFALAGAKSTRTIDVNPWLNLKYTRETWLSLADRLDEIAAVAGVNPAEVHNRYQLIDPDQCRSVEDFFRRLGIEYIFPGDARKTNIADSTIDFVISSNVLEHIPLDVQTEIHRESFRILREGGVSAHRFNPQDHYSTIDNGITHANFLKFSDENWHWYGGSGLAYHNRLRSPEYRKMMEDCGFELSVYRERIDQRSLQAIETGELVVADQFRKFSNAELAVDYIWMSAIKPVSSRHDTERQEGPQRPQRSTHH